MQQEGYSVMNREESTIMAWSKELQTSYKHQSNIKDDRKDCTICGCPITKKDFDDYKMCPWCYSWHILENEGGAIL